MTTSPDFFKFTNSSKIFQNALITSFLSLGKDRHGLVDLFPCHISFVTVLNFAQSLKQTMAASMIPIEEMLRIEALPLNSGLSNSVQLLIGRPMRSGANAQGYPYRWSEPLCTSWSLTLKNSLNLDHQ